MSDFEHLVVSELAPTLQVAAGVLNEIKKRRKKKKGDYGLYERELASALGQGYYLKTAFNEQHRRLEPYRLGDAFRTGDNIANQRIQELNLAAKGIKSQLELALQHKHDIDDIKGRSRSAEHILQQAKQTMSDLSVRITQAKTHPLQTQPSNSPLFDSHYTTYPFVSNRVSTGSSLSSIYSTPTANLPPYQTTGLNYSPYPDYIETRPTALIAPTNPKLSASVQEKGPRISILTLRRNSGASSVTTSTSDSHFSGNSPALPSTGPKSKSGTVTNNSRPAAISGRPEKKNGFHGFCEGAWTTQRDLNEGMRIMTLSNGLGRPYILLQCHKCRFRAVPYGTDKKHASMDPKVRKSQDGIQYRFQFLAKSHKYCKDIRTWGEDLEQKMATQEYACLFCYAGGRPTDKFEGIDELMSHISLEHASNMSAEVQERTHCIWGRTADITERFDINIPTALVPEHDAVALPAELDIAPLAISELGSYREDGVYLGCNMSGPVELDGNALGRINQY